MGDPFIVVVWTASEHVKLASNRALFPYTCFSGGSRDAIGFVVKHAQNTIDVTDHKSIWILEINQVCIGIVNNICENNSCR